LGVRREGLGESHLMLTIIAVAIAFNLPVAVIAIAERYTPAICRPEAMALEALDDYAARPQPCAGFEAPVCSANVASRTSRRGIPIHRRIVRKLTWV
jgi:hypothetical protein